MSEPAEDLQADALRAYTVLSSLRPDWGGALVVLCGLGQQGSAVALAGNIAGAGCLAIDQRPEACRAALQSGACDFAVNTVDEALRVLKNQIRQRRPVGVALEAEADAALAELLDRGVLPQLFTDVSSGTGMGEPPAVDPALRKRVAAMFAALGSLVVDFDGSLTEVAGAVDAEAGLDAYIRERGLQFESIGFPSAEELRGFDARLLELIPTSDPRHRWVAAAPRFFHRERPHRRVVYLTPEESERLK